MTDLTPQHSKDDAREQSVAPAFVGFTDFKLADSTLKALDKLGFTKLTPIQAKILPHTLAGQDAIGQAQTGTGKTATFLLTIIESLLKNPLPKDEKRYLAEPRALVLAPTRELAQQIYADCRELLRFNGLYALCMTGGADFDRQEAQLDARPLDILIGTPGRIIDWVSRGKLFLDRVEVLVLDEADRMLDMGFEPQIRKIVSQIRVCDYLIFATLNVFVLARPSDFDVFCNMAERGSCSCCRFSERCSFLKCRFYGACR